MDDSLRASLLNYIRSKIESMYSPSKLFGEENTLREKLEIAHKAVYLSLESTSHIRKGDPAPSRNNILATADEVIPSFFAALCEAKIDRADFLTSPLSVTVVYDYQYMAEPLSWDVNDDGVLFQWGQKYKGFYLPYQIRKMNVPKTGIMDRLCSLESGVVSSLWRLPCGLCYRIKCETVV